MEGGGDEPDRGEPEAEGHCGEVFGVGQLFGREIDMIGQLSHQTCQVLGLLAHDRDPAGLAMRRQRESSGARCWWWLPSAPTT